MTMQKKRTTNFREDETKLLIQLWGSPSIQSQMSACHRKAPIMIQLASMMQQYGFYRSPEEITTRIRNLKCIYHRIKKTLGAGLTADPDWHHFKAMDAILGDSISSHHGYNIAMDGFPRNEFKKELVDVEDIINSKFSNKCHSSECDDSREVASSPMQGLTITSSTPGSAGPSCSSPGSEQAQVAGLLQQLLDVEREHLELEKQRLELDKKIGCQLMALVPVVGGILQNQFLLQQQQRQQQQQHEDPASSEDEDDDDDDAELQFGS